MTDRLDQRIARSLELGRMLGPDYDGATFEEIARDLVSYRAECASLRQRAETAEQERDEAKRKIVDLSKALDECDHYEDWYVKATRRAEDAEAERDALQRERDTLRQQIAAIKSTLQGVAPAQAINAAAEAWGIASRALLSGETPK